MEIAAYKCDKCNFLTDKKNLYNKHIKEHLIGEEIEKKFPKETNDPSRFAYGEVFVQRDKKWLDSYKALIEKIAKSLKIKYNPWSYAWFRCLDDGGSFLYPYAVRVLNVCPVCYKEWGQGYYAKECCKELRGEK